jgi:hypothetical protein
MQSHLVFDIWDYLTVKGTSGKIEWKFNGFA